VAVGGGVFQRLNRDGTPIALILDSFRQKSSDVVEYKKWDHNQIPHSRAASDYSPNLSILLSEGKENNNDPVTNGERTPDSP